MVWLANWLYSWACIRKSVGGFKDKIVSLFTTNTTKQTMQGRGKKLSKPKKQNNEKSFTSEGNKEKINDRVFRDVRTLFKTKEKFEREKQEHTERLIKDIIIRDIRSLFKKQKIIMSLKE